jgi:sugar phosphate isomerase/epimerase
MPTIAASSIVARQGGSTLGGLHYAIDHGFRGVELMARYLDHEQLPPADLQEFRLLAALYGVDLSIHAPVGWAPATFDNEERDALLDDLDLLIQRASAIGARVIVLHPGAVEGAGIERGNVPEDKRLDALQRLTAFVRRSARTAEAEGVILAVENLPYMPGVADARGIERAYDVVKTYDELVQIVRDVRSPAVQITLDIGHADRAEGIREAFQAFGPYLRHIHIHDSDGQRDHQEIGVAKVDFASYLDILKAFPHMLVMEIIPDDDPAGAMLRSRDRLKRLLGESAR